MRCSALESLTSFCPAKINLYLAVIGRRADGFHDVVTVVAPVAVGDTLQVSRAAPGRFSLHCDDPDVPGGESNLILQAARAFAEKSHWSGGAHFALTKVIPMGAGLGGASSNAVATLVALNRLAVDPLSREDLTELAAGLGSDCPLFLERHPVVARGRGERSESLSEAARSRLEDLELLLIKPPFGVSTAWAYGQLAREFPASYRSAEIAESHVAVWNGEAPISFATECFNSFERPLWTKFQALPAMQDRLHERFGLHLHLSGSGSACFAITENEVDRAAVETVVRDGWGPTAWLRWTRIANPDLVGKS